jgi:hypothetical protein
MAIKMRILLVALTLVLASCNDSGEFHQNLSEAVSEKTVDTGTVKKPEKPTEPRYNCSIDDANFQQEYCMKENFTQTDPRKKLDILWVIDDSGSMRDEQAALAANFDAFITDFLTKDTDFKMAITTTDINKNGQMISESDVKLTSAKAKADPAQFKADFKQLVNVGTNGSGIERGLSASEGFMIKHAASFNRRDAYLALVILSDEEDQSQKATTAYVDFLKTFKESAGLVKIYSIIDVDNLKAGHERYKDASSSTSGSVASIKGDFYKTLNEIAVSISSLLDSFALAHDAVADTIEVTVDGVMVTSFTYDAATRSIKFDVGSIPPKGSKIVIAYQKK